MARTYRYRTRQGTLATRGFAESLAEYFKETWEAGKLIEREHIKLTPETGNWHDETWAGGGIVRMADGQALSEDAFDSIPDGVASFQVRFIVPYNPDYPRGWASYRTVTAEHWRDIDAILEDGGRDFQATGVGAIIFHQYP